MKENRKHILDLYSNIEEKTRRAKIDFWSGTIVSENPKYYSLNSDANKTSRVRVDPWTGKIIEVIDRHSGDDFEYVQKNISESRRHKKTPITPPPLPCQRKKQTSHPPQKHLEQDCGSVLIESEICDNYSTAKEKAAPTLKFTRVALPKTRSRVGISTILILVLISLATGATLGSGATILYIEQQENSLAFTNYASSDQGTEPDNISKAHVVREFVPQNPTVVESSVISGVENQAGNSDSDRNQGKVSHLESITVLAGRRLDEGVEGKEESPQQESSTIVMSESVVLPFHFEKNHMIPTIHDSEIIQAIAHSMVENRKLHFEVIGFASSDEGDAKQLGLRRAIYAVGMITIHGPSRSRFHTKSGGMSKTREGEPIKAGRQVILRPFEN